MDETQRKYRAGEVPPEEYVELLERSLAEANERLGYYAALLDNIHDSIIATDAELRITAWNRAAERLYGFTAQEAMGQQPQEILQSEYEEDQRQRALQHLQETGSYTVEVTQYTKDGRRLIVEGVTIPWRDSQGKIIGYVSAGRDITGRKQMEDALRASEKKTREILESISDGFFSFDREWRVTYINDLAARQGGFQAEQLIGTIIWESVPVLVGSNLETVYRTVMEERKPETVEFKSQRAMSWYELRVYPSSEGISVYSVDVTARKRFEQALRESEEKFRSSFANAAIGFAMTRPSGEFLDANPAFCRITGYGLENLTGRNIAQLVHPEECSLFLQQMEQMLAGQVEDCVFEHRCIRQDGALVWARMSLSLARDEAGAPQRLIVLVEDISQRKEAEEAGRRFVVEQEQLNQELAQVNRELEFVNRELSDFAYIASHDLQEPLRKVNKFSEMLLQRYTGVLDEEGQEYLARMVDATQRMQQMLTGLLDYARISTRGNPFRPVNLGQVAQEVLSDLEARLEQTQGVVELGSLPQIEADTLQMRQLLQNLIGNALKFHRRGEPPVVKVWAEDWAEAAGCDRDCVRLVVQDNGIGFDARHAEKIFQPFVRLHGRSSYEGSGMGLAICRKIVERHGGLIQVTSIPHQGSVFSVILPRKQNQS